MSNVLDQLEDNKHLSTFVSELQNYWTLCPRTRVSISQRKQTHVSSSILEKYTIEFIRTHRVYASNHVRTLKKLMNVL